MVSFDSILGLFMPYHKQDKAQIPCDFTPRIESDAIFIADSHFVPLEKSANPQSKEASQKLIAYFESLLSQKAPIPSQMFLMGDIAHLLIGGITSSHKMNAKLLSYIESLSAKSQIWWFEGNHDFHLNALKKAYPHLRIHIIPRKQQPKAFYYMHGHSKKHIFLAHGDIFLNKKYEYYICAMHTQCVQFLIRMLDIVTFGNLYIFVADKVNRKHIKNGDIPIVPFAQKRIKAYYDYAQKSMCAPDAIIEGHFHIGRTYKDDKTKITYISLPSFYINRSILNIESLITH